MVVGKDLATGQLVLVDFFSMVIFKFLRVSCSNTTCVERMNYHA